MGKRCAAQVLDAALDYVRQNCTLQVACSAEPTSFAEALSLGLASVTMITGDFTLGAGITGGNTPRRLIVGAKSALIDFSGTVTHLALVDTVDSILLLVTETTPTVVTANGVNVLDIPSWSEELKAPE